MTIETNRGHTPTTKAGATAGEPVAHERCADCGAALVEDQRYCLQCGARRGTPRLDFTAFWKPSSLTGAQALGDADNTGVRGNHAGTTARTARDHAATDRPWLEPPGRRVIGALAAAVLTAGVIVGALLGPTPPNSPADSSTLAERALVALATQASDSSQASAPSAPTSSASDAPPSSASHSTNHKATTSKARSGEVSVPSSPESSSPSESNASAPSSEGSSSEGHSHKESNESEKTAPGTPVKLPPIKHVWVITLSGASFTEALAQAPADPYLAKQLVPKGTLLSGYTLTAPSALANGIALLSGQGVNLDTEQNCHTYSDLQPPTVNTTNGLAEGVGCVYPQTVQTLADELTAAGLTWKAYVQGMESSQSSSSTPSTTPPAGGVTCRHPELSAADPNQTPSAADPYLTFRNPFAYFHSLLDGGACASDDVDLARLQGDLATPASIPSLSWIVPSACNDGSSTACAPGSPAGLVPADSFLKEVVPQILATAAYRKEGLIVIVSDSPPASSTGATKPVGALLLSPFVRSNARVSESLNDFSLLKSLSRLFGVLPLGHANDPSVVSFGATVYGSSAKKANHASSTAKKAAQAAPAAQPGG